MGLYLQVFEMEYLFLVVGMVMRDYGVLYAQLKKTRSLRARKHFKVLAKEVEFSDRNALEGFSWKHV